MMNYSASSAPVITTRMVERFHQLPPFDPRWALFLDFDGTLADIAHSPDLVILEPAIKAAVIAKRRRLSGAVALVSGRTIADLDDHFFPYRLSAAGMHGAEIRLLEGDSAVLRYGNYNVFCVVAARLRAALKACPGVTVELKPLAISVHYRAAPALANVCAAAVHEAIAGCEDVEAQPGKMVVEIIPRRVSKARAVEHFMAHRVFKGRIPVFIGDDAADECAIKTVQDMGGIGIRITDAVTRVPTCARIATHDAGIVREWLVAH